VVGGDQMSPVTIWQARMKPTATNTAAGINMLAVPLLVLPHVNLGGLKNNENNHKEQRYAYRRKTKSQTCSTLLSHNACG
jgi:hypothetical protein